MPTAPRGGLAFEKISGMPWIEIDFAADIARAEAEIPPRIPMAAAKRHAARMAVGHIEGSVAQER